MASEQRDSGDPIFSHPTGRRHPRHLKLDDATIAAALLHDTIEDTDATRTRLIACLAMTSAFWSRGSTKLQKVDLVSKEAKQAHNLRKLLLAIADDVRVLLITLADRLRDMRTLSHRPPEARRVTAERRLTSMRRSPAHGRPGNPRDLEISRSTNSSRRLQVITNGSKRWPNAAKAGSPKPAALAKKLADSGIPTKVAAQARFSIWRRWSESDRLRAALPTFSFPRHRRKHRRMLQALGIVLPRRQSFPAASRITFRRRAEQVPLASFHRDRAGRTARRAAIRTARNAPIAEYGIAAMRSTRTGSARRPTACASRTPMRGSAAPSNSGRGCEPGESSEHTKLELSTTRCFAAPKGKSIALPHSTTPIDSPMRCTPTSATWRSAEKSTTRSAR